jgi:hypothetical protein
MIKRLVMILAVLFGLTLGGASMASAGENHHGKTGHHKQDQKKHGKHDKHQHGNKGHHPKPPVTQCPSSCKPKPTPPPGGWPCMKDHSCKPHKPHCDTPGHHHKPPHHKPPHVKPPHHQKPPAEKPPVKVDKPVKPVTPVTDKVVLTASTVPQLPRTGGFAELYVLLGIALPYAGFKLFKWGCKTS